MRIAPLLLACLLPLAAEARTCRLLFLGAIDGDPETLHLHDGARSQEVELPRLNLSKVYELPDGEITLRLLESPPAKDAPLPAGAPAAKVPETTEDLYLLVTPDRASKTTPLRLQVIDATGSRFRTGQQMWFNLTPHDVGGKVGSRQLVLKARARAVVDPPAAAAGSYPVVLNFRIAGKEALYPLCETEWSYDPASRNVVFVVAEPGVRTPRVLGFPDQRADAGKKP